MAGVQYLGGAIQKADAVIVATGGKSYSATGSTGDGYAFARSLGHDIVPPRPALIPLETVEEWPGELMGLSLKNVTLNYYKGKKKIFSELGELLFTHFGLSGPLCLSLSSYLPDEPMGLPLFIDLKPALSEETLDNRLLRDFKEMSRKQLISVLDGLAPHNLALMMARLAGLSPAQPVHSVTAAQRGALKNLLKHLPLTAKRFRPLEEAIITRGGVSVKQVNPSTMESKLAPALYFAGEVLDVDALTGGFNLPNRLFHRGPGRKRGGRRPRRRPRKIKGRERLAPPKEALNMDTNISGSRTVSRAAVLMCMSRTREEEKQLKLELMQDGVKAAAVDYGGEFISSVMRQRGARGGGGQAARA